MISIPLLQFPCLFPFIRGHCHLAGHLERGKCKSSKYAHEHSLPGKLERHPLPLKQHLLLILPGSGKEYQVTQIGSVPLMGYTILLCVSEYFSLNLIPSPIFQYAIINGEKFSSFYFGSWLNYIINICIIRLL